MPYSLQINCPRFGATAALVALFMNNNAAHACAVCMGAQGTPQMDGVNAGLLTMLGMMGAVFGLGVFFVARMAWLAHRVDCASPTQAQTVVERSTTAHEFKEIGG